MTIHEAITKKQDLEQTIKALVNQFVELTNLEVENIKVVTENYHGDKFCSEVEV